MTSADAIPETTGHCLCGRVKYRAVGEPKWRIYCHCESCRRATGVPVTVYAAFPEDRFRLVGEPARYESSPGVTRTFCRHCGTPLTYQAADLPGEIHLLTGSVDNPEAAHLVPQYHVFDNERISWVDIGAGLPREKPGGA
jgi:hypothetical protein